MSWGCTAASVATRPRLSSRHNIRRLVIAFLAILFVHTLASSHHGIDQVQEIFTFQDGYIDWLFLQKLVLAVACWACCHASTGSRYRRWTMSLSQLYDLLRCTCIFLYVAWREIHFGKLEGNVFTCCELLIVGTIARVQPGGLWWRDEIFGRGSRILVGS